MGLEMDVIDRRNLYARLLEENGVLIRHEDLNGTHSGLCRVADKKILLLELSLTAEEQLEIMERTLACIDKKPKKSAA